MTPRPLLSPLLRYAALWAASCDEAVRRGDLASAADAMAWDEYLATYLGTKLDDATTEAHYSELLRAAGFGRVETVYRMFNRALLVARE